MKHIDKLLALCFLVFAIGFNLWLYRLEPTARVDPNDNPFQFALVDRTNQIWDFAAKTCPKNLTYPLCHFSYLVDHWVPNWAEGYNLPFYYSHLPQIAIVGTWRFVNLTIGLISQISPIRPISLFQYYHWLIYLLLSLFPLSLFLALGVVGAPWLIAGFAALIASHLSTDGLYGLDPSSFLWRGYGLSSQLFAMIWLPLALAYSYRYLQQNSSKAEGVGRQFIEQLKICAPFMRDKTRFANFHLARAAKNQPESQTSRAGLINSSTDSDQTKNFWLAVLFTTLTASGHLGLGIMAILSIGIMGVYSIVRLLHCYIAKKMSFQQLSNQTIEQLIKLFLLPGTTIFLLSYWIVPILLNNNYHNISFWDPVWKFDSYGAREVLTNLFNGALFDFGRFPWLTILTLIGFFGLLTKNPKTNHEPRTMNYELFSFLFLFWLIMYFGRTTWGRLIGLVPGMEEFHLSRFLVGVQISGLFLAPLALWRVVTVATQKFTLWLQNLLEEAKYKSIENRLSYFTQLIIYSLFLILILPSIYKQTIEYSRHNDRLIRQANTNFEKVKSDVDELFSTLKTLPPGRIFAGRGGGWGKDFRVAETPYYMHISTYGWPSTLWLPETWSPNSDIEQYFSEDQLRDYQLFGIRYVLAPPDQKPQLQANSKQVGSWIQPVKKCLLVSLG